MEVTVSITSKASIKETIDSLKNVIADLENRQETIKTGPSWNYEWMYGRKFFKSCIKNVAESTVED